MAQDRSLPPLTALQAFHAAGRKGSFEAAARACGHTLGHQSSDPRTRTVARQATVPAPGPTRGAHSRRSRPSQGGGSVIRASPHCGRSPEGGGEYPDDATHQRAAAIHERLADPAEHPNIVLNIDSTNRVVDFGRELVDLAIRNIEKPTPGLEHRKLLDFRPVPMCTAKLRQQLCRPTDLARHTLIHVSGRPSSWARWLAAVGCAGLHPSRELTFDSVTAASEAAAHDRGIVLGMDPIAWDAPITSKLVRALSERVEGTASYYLVCRKTDLARPKVRAFVNWLTTEMAAYRRQLKRERGADRAA